MSYIQTEYSNLRSFLIAITRWFLEPLLTRNGYRIDKVVNVESKPTFNGYVPTMVVSYTIVKVKPAAKPNDQRR